MPQALQLYRLVVANGGRYAGMAQKRIDRLTSLRARKERSKKAAPKPAALDAMEMPAEQAEPAQAEPATKE